MSKKPSSTLKKTTKKQTKVNEAVSGRFIQYPYDKYDKSRLSFEDPKPFNTGVAEIYTPAALYEYDVTKDGQIIGKVIAPLKIQGPEEEGEQLVCSSGLKDKMIYPPEELEKAKKDPTYAKVGNPTGDYKAFCYLNPRIPSHQKIREILHDVYMGGLQYMEDNGKRGTGKLPGKSYPFPDDEGYATEADHLLPPLLYKTKVEEKDDPKQPGKKINAKVKDFDADAIITFTVSANPEKKRLTEFRQIVTEKMTQKTKEGTKDVKVAKDIVLQTSDLKGRGWVHVPLFSISIIICPVSSIRLKLESTLITDIRPLVANEQKELIQSQLAKYQANNKDVFIRSQLDGLIDESDSSVSSDEEAVPQKHVPAPAKPAFKQLLAPSTQSSKKKSAKPKTPPPSSSSSSTEDELSKSEGSETKQRKRAVSQSPPPKDKSSESETDVPPPPEKKTNKAKPSRKSRK